jgi:hypothetical protein
LFEDAFFKNFKVEQRGYGIMWNENIDLSEYERMAKWHDGGTRRSLSSALGWQLSFCLICNPDPA